MFGTIVGALVLFIVGRWRHDVVALLALLAVSVTGVVRAPEAFAGFGHPAVVTVAGVLVVSRGLLNSGFVDVIARWMLRVGNRPTLQVATVTALVAVFSGFMNNVGAAALLMPVTIRMARTSGHPPSLLLMPLAFGSLLGGMTTLIGTPPNIIIATFREQTGAAPFGMFDFTPVGLGVALAGVLYISIIGWRLIPRRKGQALREEIFQIEDYITEVRMPEGSKMVGSTLGDLEDMTDENVVVVGLVRGERRRPAPSSFEALRAGDILILEADSDALKALVDAAGLELVGSKDLKAEILGSADVSVIEAVIMRGSRMEGNTASSLNLHRRYGMNLLAVARQGARLKERLGRIRLRAGDVLLLQGRTDTLYEMMQGLGCLPLAERGVQLGHPRRILLAVGIFGTALAAAVTGLLSIQIAITGAAVAMVLTNLLSLREAHESIDWSVIILLGAMIPVGQALDRTGAAQLVAAMLFGVAGQLPPAGALTIVLVGAMILTPLINNAAAAVLMAPIAAGSARGLGVSADPFLMAVCIGSSCDFVTPIGHQSNILVMGPGGYKFGDYSRMGVLLELIVAVVAIPLLLWLWPLGVR